MTHDLLTIADIAALLRRSRRTVAEVWVQRPDFPAPAYAPTRWTRLWWRAEVEKWAAPKKQLAQQEQQ